jgi:hypothetical protein
MHVETHLLIEIKDIQDELDTVASIFREQYDVLNSLYKLCSTKKDTEDDSSSLEKSNQKRVPGVNVAAYESEKQSDSLDKPRQKGILHLDNEKEEALLRHKKRERKQIHFPNEYFGDTENGTPLLKDRGLVDDNLDIVMGNLRTVEDMQIYAMQVQNSVFIISLGP